MPIIYSLVARGSTILAEYTNSTGNFTTATQSILDKIPATNGKMSYVYDRYYFHYIAEDGIVYMCMADEDFGRRIPFAFLEDIIVRWKNTYKDRGQTAMAYGMNEEFSRTLAKQMDYFSNNPNADRINEVRGEINAVKDVMVQNIEKVLERGEKMELLVDKTDSLNQAAFQFKKKSTQLKRSMWWKNTKLMIVLVFVCLFVLYLIISLICGFPAWGRCIKGKDGDDTTPTSDPVPTPDGLLKTILGINNINSNEYNNN